MTLPRGIVISAPSSGSGKTLVTLGLLSALRARGIAVQPFKSGPDYIDPAFHGAAAGRASFNLDSWAMPDGMLHTVVAQAKGADLVMAEGAMGLFDGVARRGAAGNGSTAGLAAMMGWPVVVVMDAGGQAQTAAAVALGLSLRDPACRVAGVILNKVASARHESLLRAGFDGLDIPILGALPRDKSVALPERHLGLVQAAETADLAARMAAMGDFIAAHVDLDAILAAARPTKAGAADQSQLPPPPAQRIALAQDAAFSFTYPHLRDHWRRMGAEVLPFSPLADEPPEMTADFCWLPGGYPELHGATLAAATRFRNGLRDFAQRRGVHGECGGYMALGRAIVGADGVAYPMAGLLELETSFAARKMHLGYRCATLARPLGAIGGALRGHEFHYATITAQGDAPLAQVTDANGETVTETGSYRATGGGGMVSGTFFHMIAKGGA